MRGCGWGEWQGLFAAVEGKGGPTGHVQCQLILLTGKHEPLRHVQCLVIVVDG